MEQRAEPRRGYFAHVQVRFRSDEGEKRSIEGMIEDRSHSGLGIRVSKPVAVGSEITVLQGSVTLHGKIRRCVPDGSGYLLGIKLLSSGVTE